MIIYIYIYIYILTKRKESNAYLATVSRHRWSRQIRMKIDKMQQLSASTVVFISSLPLQLMKATVLAESYYILSIIIICRLQRCPLIVDRQVSLSFLLVNLFFIRNKVMGNKSIASRTIQIGTNVLQLIQEYHNGVTSNKDEIVNKPYYIIGWELTVEIYNVIFSQISNLQIR